jgi:hypothetical protein
VGGCVVISDKAQHTRKWALSWAHYRRRDTFTSHTSFEILIDLFGLSLLHSINRAPEERKLIIRLDR